MEQEEQSRGYSQFTAAIYARAYEVMEMADLSWLEPRFSIMDQAMKPDKIYLETHRDMLVVPEDDLVRIKAYFEERGIETAGGITITVDEGNLFQSYCYTNPEHRAKLEEVVRLTARHFDEFILDDFFFTNCKCDRCIEAKGERTWSEFRLELLEKASEELILGPAKDENPGVEVVVKFPNWYEHYQQCGLNLEAHVKHFDRIYTGTETRDPVNRNQHLQEYLGYGIIRYLNNAMPGGNGGGWVDPGAMGTLDRYAEQVWITLFGKTPEITFFDFRQLQNRIEDSMKGSWQKGGTSLDFEAVKKRAEENASNERDVTIAYAAGAALETADAVLGDLGNPLGIAAYKPFHSTGEDFIHTYMGMIGIPMEMTPRYPEDAETIFLAESAYGDPDILLRIEKSLRSGSTIIITGGLLGRLQDKGMDRIVEVEKTDQKAMVTGFITGFSRRVDLEGGAAERGMLFSHIRYNTNDSWEEVSGLGPYTGYPVLLHGSYGRGKLMVFNVPDNWSDLYRLPVAVVNKIREQICGGMPVYLEGASRTALFVYDNDTAIVESFHDEAVEVSLRTPASVSTCTNISTGEPVPGQDVEAQVFWRRQITPAGRRFTVKIPAHSFVLLRFK